MKNMKKLHLLVDAHSPLFIRIGFGLIIASNTINNCVAFFNPSIAVSVYFMTTAIAYLFLGLGRKSFGRFEELFFYLSIAHLCDELLGRGSVIDWQEYLVSILTIIYVYRADFKDVRYGSIRR